MAKHPSLSSRTKPFTTFVGVLSAAALTLSMTTLAAFASPPSPNTTPETAETSIDVTNTNDTPSELFVQPLPAPEHDSGSITTTTEELPDDITQPDTPNVDALAAANTLPTQPPPVETLSPVLTETTPEIEVRLPPGSPSEGSPVSAEPVITLQGAENTGVLKVRITTTGAPEAVGKSFMVGYHCHGFLPGVQEKRVVGDGTPQILLENVPVGQECQVSLIGTSKDKVKGYVHTVVDEQGKIATKAGPEGTVHDIQINYRKAYGKFSVAKKLVGVTGDFSDHFFKVDYVCFHDSKVINRGSIPFKGDGIPVPVSVDIPIDATCEIEESPAYAELPGHTWFPHQKEERIFIQYEHSMVPVTIVNNYNTQTNTIAVALNATGAPDAESKRVFITYQCENGIRGNHGVQGNNQPVELPTGQIPVGTECKLRMTPSSIQGYGTAVSLNETIVVTEQPQPIMVRKNIEYVPGGNTFLINKTFSGAPEAVGKTFKFSYNCEGIEGTISYTPHENPDAAPDRAFPEGTKCTVTEDVSAAQIPGYDLTPPPAQTITIRESRFAPSDADFVNTYKPNGQVFDGTFQVAKKVVGAPEGSSKTFTFDYTCGAKNGTVQAKGDGVPVTVSENFAVGTQCTVTEQVSSAQIDGYALQAPSAQTVTIVKDLTPRVSFTNTYTEIKKGTFSVKPTLTVDKLVNGKPDLESKSLTFDYTCGTQKGSIVTTGNTAQDVGKEFPVGTECRVELNDSTTSIPHYAYTAPPAQTFTITETAHQAIFSVDYTLKAAAFLVHKIVEGAPNELVKDKSFFFTYKCSINGEPITPAGMPDVLEVKDVFNSGLIFPVGTVCEISEDTSRAQIEGYTLEATEPLTFELDSLGQPRDFAFINTYTRDTGTFTITKNSTGVDTKDKNFTFTYTCGDQNGRIITPGDGKLTASKVMVPTGTECTVAEDPTSAAINGYTHTPPKAQTFTITTKGETINLIFNNTYASNAKPGATPGKTTHGKVIPGTSLAKTGTDLAVIIIGAFVFLLLGIGIYTKKH